VTCPTQPLFFGRLDYRARMQSAAGAAELRQQGVAEPSGQASAFAGERFHVGRRHVHDPAGRPVVVDWRAPVSRAFYRASPVEPMGVELRRRFGFSGGTLTAYEDERLTDLQGLAAGGTVSRILTEEIERPRSGPMRDIVATIQPDQDDIPRSR
jgi:DNA helicase IV